MEQSILGKINNVSLYGSRSQEGHISAIIDLIQALRGAGLEVSVEKKLGAVLAEAGFRGAVHGVKTCTSCPGNTDLAISIGGDGTFLRTARWLRGNQVPVLGINTGHLGFLAENNSDDADAIVRLITSGNARVERRMVLKVEGDSIPDGEWLYALNEVAILKGAASMIDVEVNVDGFHLADYRADGLIAATPTGSTAYNLSVGGPIMAPSLDCMVLSPIAPHTLTLRPVVVGGSSVVEAVVESRASEFRLSIDGSSVSLPCGAKIRISRAGHDVLTVHSPGENFASTLRSKLLWGH